MNQRSLSPLAVSALEAIYQHRLLSNEQLRTLHAPGTHHSVISRAMGELSHRDLVSCVRARAVRSIKLWFCSERGAQTVEALGLETAPRRKLLSPEDAGGTLQAHTVAVNDVGLAFVQAARAHGHECGALAWRHEVAHPVARRGRGPSELVIADAVLRYTVVDPGGAQFLTHFIEVDRATMEPGDLVEKLRRYARLYRYVDPDAPRPASPRWQQLYPAFPGLLIVFTGRRTRSQLERRLALTLALCRAAPELVETEALQVSFALLEDLTIQGPFAAIFSTLHPQSGQVNLLGAADRRAAAA